MTAGWNMPGLKIMDVDVKIISINIANHISTLYIAININTGKNQPSLIQKYSQRQFQSIFLAIPNGHTPRPFIGACYTC